MERMEFRHLRTIVAVAHHRSFTKAAEELYLAQSAISQQIRRLEEELGIQVFRRSSRSVELTEEGEVILGHAQRVLAEVDDMQSEMEELTGVMRGTVRIGGVWPSGPTTSSACSPTSGGPSRRAVHMVEDTQEEVLAKLRADELDCAFTAVDPDTIGAEFAGTLLWEEEFVVVAAPHPFAAQAHVTWEDLVGAGPDRLPRQLGPAPALRDDDLQRGIEPRNAFVCTEMSAVRALAAKGLGVAVMPRSIAELDGPPVVLRPFRPDPVTWPIALVWRSDRRQPPAAKAFLSLALERAEPQPVELAA